MGVLIKEDIAILVALLLFSSALWAVRPTLAASLGEGWSYESIYVVGALGSTSSLSHGVTLLPSDGSCAARFQLAYWKYKRWDNPRLGTTREYWRIVQTQNWFIVCEIHDGSMTTCSDDLESITYSGYNSISYAARYKSQDISTGVFKLKNTSSNTWVYKYKFGPPHSWSIDYLDSNGLIWAFSLRW